MFQEHEMTNLIRFLGIFIFHPDMALFLTKFHVLLTHLIVLPSTQQLTFIFSIIHFGFVI